MADDLAKTIASIRRDVGLASRLNSDMLRINLDLLTRLLDAAEAGMRAAQCFTVEEVKTLTDDAERHARDAALEEAADIIEDSRGEVEDDDNGRSAAVDEHCRFLVARIRALRRPA